MVFGTAGTAEINAADLRFFLFPMEEREEVELTVDGVARRDSPGKFWLNPGAVWPMPGELKVVGRDILVVVW